MKHRLFLIFSIGFLFLASAVQQEIYGVDPSGMMKDKDSNQFLSSDQKGQDSYQFVNIEVKLDKPLKSEYINDFLIPILRERLLKLSGITVTYINPSNQSIAPAVAPAVAPAQEQAPALAK